FCSHVHHVQTESDLRPEWFGGASAVGITAGTSTPDHVIDRIERCIEQFAATRDDRTSHAAERERLSALRERVRAGSWSWCLRLEWRGSKRPACITSVR